MLEWVLFGADLPGFVHQPSPLVSRFTGPLFFSVHPREGGGSMGVLLSARDLLRLLR